jgi:release factor glutamine methyltransferase
MKIREAINSASARLAKAGVENPRREAEKLLEYVLGKRRFELLMCPADEIGKDSHNSFMSLVEKRCRHTPPAYLTGETEFMSLPFAVTEEVMIPRPETEILVEKVLSKLSGQARVLDVGTGCGNIAVSLAKHSDSCVLATDISPQALEISGENAIRNEVDKRIGFLCGDMFRPLAKNACNGKFDFVVSNPPYVRRGEIRNLPREVRDFEPGTAFDGGEDGLTFYRVIAKECRELLKTGGYIAVEVGFDQAQSVWDIFREYFKSVEITKDYSGIERVITAQKQD